MSHFEVCGAAVATAVCDSQHEKQFYSICFLNNFDFLKMYVWLRVIPVWLFYIYLNRELIHHGMVQHFQLFQWHASFDLIGSEPGNGKAAELFTDPPKAAQGVHPSGVHPGCPSCV